MIDRIFTKLSLAGALIFFIGLAAPEYSYAQKNEKQEDRKKIRKNRRRLEGEQAKFSKWQREYENYLLKRSVKESRIRVGPRRRISVSSTPVFYAQPDPYASRKFRSERQRISKKQDVYVTTPRNNQRPAKKQRIRTSSASGRYIVNRRANPYRLRDKDRWEKTYSGDFYGRRAGVYPKNTQNVSITPQPDPYGDRGRRGDKPYTGVIQGGAVSATKRGERAWKGDVTGQKIRSDRSATRKRINVFPSVSPYGGRRSEGDRISRNQDFYGATPRDPQGTPGKGRVNNSSASGRYIVTRKAKPYKLRDTKKWEETYAGDFYGRRAGVSPANTQRVSVTAQPNPYSKRGRMGDKPYRGKISGDYRTATKKGERAWSGDVAGRRINRSTPRNTQQVGVSLGGSRVTTASGGSRNNGGRAIKTPGGGSVTGQLKRNNDGKPLPSSTPGTDTRRISMYSGKIKAEEIYFKFGTSHLQYEGDIPAEDLKMGFSTDHINFSGNVKTKRPLKGGGTFTPKMKRDNDGKALVQWVPGSESARASKYTGRIKAEEIYFKFGTGHLQYEGDIPAEDLKMGFSTDHINYSGNIKARKPSKGGGSVARNDWNNAGRALPQKYSQQSSGQGTFNFLGVLKPDKKSGASASRAEVWNNDETALVQKYERAKWSGHTGKVKQKSDYTRNKNADEDALKVRQPNKAYFAAGNFTGKTKKKNRKIDGQLHSSTKFHNSKGSESAVEEKKKFFSFKILWNKLFGKDIPEKENERKPRYDKGEKGLWNE